jgi:beta-galactosidase
MPNVTFNGQCFVVDGRRVWTLGASMQYTRIPPDQWVDRLADARQAGFNTIETACPWMVHEPRRGRFHFEGAADVRGFVEACAAERMRVILRPGPFVGGGFDGGGIPNWLLEDPDVALRESGEAFLDGAGRYFRKLFGELSELQVTKSGPILLVQIEHGWMCDNHDEAERYLRELTRIVRECGISVPLINANNLWTEPVGTIDTWRGDDDLLVNLRQLRSVQPNAPRLVRCFETNAIQAWGQPERERMTAEVVLRRMAEILAAGAQPIVTPFHGGTNFGFLPGRLPGPDGGPITTSAAIGAPLGEAGERGETYNQIRRLVTFADQFSHVFADLDPDYQPVALDPGEIEHAAGARKSGTRRSPDRRTSSMSIVPLRGAGGRVIFAFSDGSVRATTLLLDHGVRLPIDLGKQAVGWYVLDVDLRGRGRLDYSNLCPLGVLESGVAVLYGPQRSEAIVSINGTPLQINVPSGNKPLVVEHQGVHLVICNQKQIDATYLDEHRIYVGIRGFDRLGTPLPAAGWTKAVSIGSDGSLSTVSFDEEVSGRTRRTRRSIGLSAWQAATAESYTSGGSPRYASLPGPQTLPECGAPVGYGWYRLQLKASATKKMQVHAPQAADRMHLFVDGEPACSLGEGPGVEAGPCELRLTKGERVLTALVDNIGRFADGNDLGRRTGLFGHIYEVKSLRTTKPKEVDAPAVDPFLIRRFIIGASRVHKSDSIQVEWAFTHARKAPVLVDVNGATAHGTFVLNDVPIHYYAGDTGACRDRLLLEPATLDAFKRGRNVLRFAPDVGQNGAAKDIIKHTTIYECANALTDNASWSFAKWEAPTASSFEDVSQNAASRYKGQPCWWRCTFDAGELTDPLWFETAGLSKGQAFINGHHLGRYFTSTSTGRAVGPQDRLLIPSSWVNEDRSNELLIFDEHGFSPHRTRLVFNPTGPLD